MYRRRMTELRRIALALLATWGMSGHAAGLGPIRVQSELGQPLRASVALLGEDAGETEANCIRARIESTDGVFIATPQIGLTQGKSPALQLATRQSINEPAVTIQIGIGCATAVTRNYQILLDPVAVSPAVVPAQQAKPAQKSPSLAQKNARSDAIQPAASMADASVPKKRRPAKTDKVQPASADLVAEAAPMLPKAVEAPGRSKSQRAMRNVLKLSGDDLPVGTGSFAPRLKMAESLSIPVTEADSQKLAEVRAAQAQFAALMRDENVVRTSEERVKAAQAELHALKAQTEKLKQQRQADQAALVSLQSESFSFNWVAGLGALLAVCLAAIAWLLWRFYDIQKTSGSSSWKENVADLKTRPVDLDSFDTGTAFGNTAFNTTAFGDSQFGDTVPIETECDKITKSIENLPTIIDLNPGSEFVFDDMETGPAAPPPPAPRARSGRSLDRHEPPRERAPRPNAQDTINPKTRDGIRRPSDELALKAEEIADVMQLAELWVSLNDPKRAIQILEPLSDVERPESPAPWIYLLDLYRATGNREKYENVQKRIERVFNAKISDWDAIGPEVPRTLDDYPHIVEAISVRWNGTDIVPYLESLLLNDRDDARDGFDLSVYRDIIQLISLASEPDPAARREHMEFGQAHAILFRRREEGGADGQAQAAAVPGAPVPVQPEQGIAKQAPVSETAGRPARVPKQAPAPEAPSGLASIPKKEPSEDGTLGVPEIKMSGQPAGERLPFLKEPSFDPFAHPAAPARKAAPDKTATDEKSGAGDMVPPFLLASTAPKAPSTGKRPFSEKSPPGKKNLPIILESIPEKDAPAPDKPHPAPLQAAAPQESKAAADTSATNLPDDAAAAPAGPIAAAPQSIENGDPAALTQGLSYHAEHDDSSVMATKLHLAIAYQEIGEKDGARLLLEEVIRGGTPEQSERARLMLSVLARGDE